MIAVARKPDLRVTGALIACVSAASLLLLFQFDGNVALAIALPAAVGVLYLFWHLPLRIAGVTIFFLHLTVERMGDTGNLYRTPLYGLGVALTTKFSVLTNIKPLQFSAGDLLCLLLLAIAMARAGRRSDIDGAAPVPTVRPLGTFAALFAIVVCLEFARGLMQHGNLTNALMQFRALIHVPFYFLTFQVCLRGPEDFPLVGRAVVLAAVLRACLALTVRYVVAIPQRLRPVEFMTNHDDSMTFATALIILFVSLSEETNRRTVLRTLLVAPVIVWGTVVNQRRLAWVDLAMGLFVYAVLSPRTRLKRAIARGIVMLIPVTAIYFAVGWNSSSTVFGPVHVVKSIVSSEADRSTLDRDVENWNIATSVSTNPLLGRGLGHDYDERVPMDDISQAFPMYKAMPHNSVLGLWCFFGLIGVIALWSLFVAGFYFAARAYHRLHRPDDRTAAYAAIGAMVVFLNQCYGDMAFWTDIGSVLTGMALAVAGKAAAASNAWPAPRARAAFAADEAIAPRSAPSVVTP